MNANEKAVFSNKKDIIFVCLQIMFLSFLAVFAIYNMAAVLKEKWELVVAGISLCIAIVPLFVLIKEIIIKNTYIIHKMYNVITTTAALSVAMWLYVYVPEVKSIFVGMLCILYCVLSMIANNKADNNGKNKKILLNTSAAICGVVAIVLYMM